LEKDPNRRLGGGPDDAEEVKSHPIFNNINWHKLYKKEIKPPFKPTIESETDTSNFDPVFTNSAPTDSLPNNSPAPLSDTLQQNFEGFTYSNEMSTVVIIYLIFIYLYLKLFLYMYMYINLLINLFLLYVYILNSL